MKGSGGKVSVVVKNRVGVSLHSRDCVNVSFTDFVKMNIGLGDFVKINNQNGGEIYLRVVIDSQLTETTVWNLYNKHMQKLLPQLNVDPTLEISAGNQEVVVVPVAQVAVLKRIRLSPMELMSQDVGFASSYSIIKDIKDRVITKNGKVPVLLENGQFVVCLVEWEEEGSIGIVDEDTAIILKKGSKLSYPDVLMVHLEAHRKIYENLMMMVAMRSSKGMSRDINLVPSSLLLYGPPGSGKTLTLTTIAKQLAIPVVYASPSNIMLQFNKEVSSSISHFFSEAIESAPSILLFDNMDISFSIDEDTTSVSGERFTSYFLSEMEKLKNERHSVIVVGVTNDISSIEHSIRCKFEAELKISHPTANDRYKLFQSNTHFIQILEPNTDVKKFSDSCHGYTPSDIYLLIQKVIQFHSLTNQKLENGGNQLKISETTLYQFKNSFLPIGISNITPEIPHLTWNDLGGLHAIKTKLKESVIWFYEHSEKFKKFGISTNSGILLYGPPGTGKTSLAKAVATESHANFLTFNMTDLIFAEVGESEKKIAQIFQTAREHSPCIIFFDEIQSIFGSRDNQNEFGATLIAQLLMEMQGITENNNLVVIAATNLPELIDPALLRPGRFDRLIYVPPPDDLSRREIFRNILSKLAVEKELLEIPYLNTIAEQTKNATGAEIRNICLKAGLTAFSQNSPFLTKEHLDEQIEAFTPINTEYYLESFNNFAKENKE